MNQYDFLQKLNTLCSKAVQGYWKRMFTDRELEMYCPRYEYIEDELLDAYYFEDDAGEYHHPATIVLLGVDGVYVQGGDEKMYMFRWQDSEAAFRYVKMATRI